MKNKKICKSFSTHPHTFVPPVLLAVGVSWMFRLVPTFVVLLRPPGILWAPLSGVFNQRKIISGLSPTKDADARGVLVLSVTNHIAVDALCSSCDNHGRPWSPSVHVSGSGSPAWDFKIVEDSTSSLPLYLLYATCLNKFQEHADLPQALNIELFPTILQTWNLQTLLHEQLYLNKSTNFKMQENCDKIWKQL